MIGKAIPLGTHMWASVSGRSAWAAQVRQLVSRLL
jgi:hypothetical protein